TLIGGTVAGMTGLANSLGGAILNGVSVGSSGGFSSGFIGGAGNAWINGADFWKGIDAGFTAGEFGALGGGISGGISGGIQYHKQIRFFSKGCEALGVNAGDPVQDPNDQFLKDAAGLWFPGAPTDKMDVFTVDRAGREFTGEYIKDGGHTIPQTIKRDGISILNGRSRVYFNKNVAFSSYKFLYGVMGHELVHVSQIASLAGRPLSFLDNIVIKKYIMEYWGYSYQYKLYNDIHFDYTPMNSFKDMMKIMMSAKYLKYFNSFNYSNYSWTSNANYVGPD
ncbi:MAG TPA: RHS repeat-associated core domain-containing protein, partial [Bacteroidales bacterium]